MAFLSSNRQSAQMDGDSSVAQSAASQLDYDIRGQICPSTLLTALREINRYKRELKDEGMTLFFWTDNRDAIATIPEAARNMGYRAEVTKRDGAYAVMVKSGQSQP